LAARSKKRKNVKKTEVVAVILPKRGPLVHESIQYDPFVFRAAVEAVILLEDLMEHAPGTLGRTCFLMGVEWERKRKKL
jgi:hypothetical protein